MRKTLEQKIEANKQEMEKLQAAQDLLIAEFEKKEEQAKLERLYKRGDHVEKHLPELIKLTEKQFYTFVEKTLLTPHTRRILDELTVVNAPPPAAPKASDSTVQPPAKKT
jgi:hypothetical protein